MKNKIKPMTIDEMVLALDRMSRFKFPVEKLKRVYIETICSNFVFDFKKKSDLQNLDNKELVDIFTLIWNTSIKHNFNELSSDFELNKNYINEEKRCYKLSLSQLKLLPQEVDFFTLTKNIKKVPNNFCEYKTPRKMLLTEGVTEEILLPEFSKICNYDFEKNNIKIIATGGKNQLLKQYAYYKEFLRIPIYILLDNDAQSVFEQLNLRKIDKAHLIKSGEIEDIIPKNLFKNAINSEFKLQSKISVKDFDSDLSMVKNLKKIFKDKGFGEFKKAKVADWIKRSLTKSSVLSDELVKIFEEIASV